MTTSPQGSAREELIGKQAVSVLARLGLELTPENFHLVTLLLGSGNSELRRSFSMMRRPVSQADITELTRQVLPHLFEPPEKVTLALGVAQELPQIHATMEEMRQSLAQLSEQLVKVQAVVDAVEDETPAPVRHVLSLLSQSVEAQAQMNAQVLQSLAGWLETLQPTDVLVSAPAMTPSLTTPVPAEPPPHAVPLVPTHGLGERAQLMSRLQALHSGEQHLDGYSLMLCRVSGFEAYRSPVMRKARDYLLDTLGQQTSRMIGKTDSACWMSADEMGLLLDSDNEIHLTDVSQRLRRLVDGALTYARHTVKDLPPLGCRFGCATAFGAASPALLYSSARLALQRAELTEDDRLLINTVSPPAANRRYTAIYNRH
jgi:GGDEF domain-containing protein